MEKFMTYFSPQEQEEVREFLALKPPNIEKIQYRGYNIFPGFSMEAITYLHDEWKLKKNDVFVVSYPKTGTNWVSEIVRRIIYQDKETAELSVQMPLQFSLLGFGNAKKFKLLEKLPFERRYIASHLPADLMNLEKVKQFQGKVVYVVRNPKDQMVSWFNYAHKIQAGKTESWKTMLGSGWEKYFEHVVSGDFDMNTKPGQWYPDHVLSWYRHLDNETVYFIYYENLKKNPVQEIRRLAKFLEVSLSEEKLKEITEETSFNKMKQVADETSNMGVKIFRNFNMRKGEVGGWKDYFTVRQSERIDEIIREKFKDTDIEFLYEL